MTSTTPLSHLRNIGITAHIDLGEVRQSHGALAGVTAWLVSTKWESALGNRGLAMRLGAVTYLTREEAEAAAACNAAQIDRSWELWKMRAERRLQPRT